jgi:hypothetical protein
VANFLNEAKQMNAKTLMDFVYNRVAHGDEEHKKWLREECDKLAIEFDKDWLVLDPVKKAQLQEGIKLYRKYAGEFIAFQKMRSGQFELTENEKQIDPSVRLAFALLQL